MTATVYLYIYTASCQIRPTNSNVDSKHQGGGKLQYSDINNVLNSHSRSFHAISNNVDSDKISILCFRIVANIIFCSIKGTTVSQKSQQTRLFQHFYVLSIIEN